MTFDGNGTGTSGQPSPSIHTPSTHRRLAVFGDVGGHAASFAEELIALGADPSTGSIPEHLVICQVGDLIHRGPDSSAVIAMVERFRINGGGRWVQLMGNHEVLYTKGPSFHWPESIPRADGATIKSWWDSGWMKLAAGFETSGLVVRRMGGAHEPVGEGPLLISHAGLTAGLWLELGGLANVYEIADAINADGHARPFNDHSGVFRPGMMLTRSIDAAAGVVWAECTSELYESWLSLIDDGGVSLPAHIVLHQVHGHSNPFRFDYASWNQPLKRRVDESHRNASNRVLAFVDRTKRLSRVELGPIAFFGVDPGHHVKPAPTWKPLVFELV